MEEDNNIKEESEFKIELYKSLRGEVSSYIEKVPGLWLQKFLLAGVVIAFIIQNHKDLVKSDNPTLLVAAVIAIPILAGLLDVKILEYGLHARAISQFIKEKFKEPKLLEEWESCLWGDLGEQEILKLVRFRSRATVLVTSVPTAGLIVLSGLVISEIIPTYSGWWIVSAVAIAALYLLATWIAWKQIWTKSLEKTEIKTTLEPTKSVVKRKEKP